MVLRPDNKVARGKIQAGFGLKTLQRFDHGLVVGFRPPPRRFDDVFQQVQIDPGDPVVLGSQHPIPLDFSSLWVHTDQSSELGIEPLEFFRDLVKIAGEFRCCKSGDR